MRALPFILAVALLPLTHAAAPVAGWTPDARVVCAATASGAEAACAAVLVEAEQACWGDPEDSRACRVTLTVKTRALADGACAIATRTTKVERAWTCASSFEETDRFVHRVPGAPSGGYHLRVPLEICVRGPHDAFPTCETRSTDTVVTGSHYACGGCSDHASGANGYATGSAFATLDDAPRVGLREAEEPTACHLAYASCATGRARLESVACTAAGACDADVVLDLAASGHACHFVLVPGADWTRACSTLGAPLRTVLRLPAHVERPAWSQGADPTDVLVILCTGEASAPDETFPRSSRHACVAWPAGAVGPTGS